MFVGQRANQKHIGVSTLHVETLCVKCLNIEFGEVQIFLVLCVSCPKLGVAQYYISSKSSMNISGNGMTSLGRNLLSCLRSDLGGHWQDCIL